MKSLRNCNDGSQKKGICNPTLMSCQHYVLDRIFGLVMDKDFSKNLSSPNIKWSVASKFVNTYKGVKTQFVNGKEQIHFISGWGDEMKFLCYLTFSSKFLF